VSWRADRVGAVNGRAFWDSKASFAPGALMLALQLNLLAVQVGDILRGPKHFAVFARRIEAAFVGRRA
jgi:hypothetical protein